MALNRQDIYRKKEKGAHGSRASPKGMQPLSWKIQKSPGVSSVCAPPVTAADGGSSNSKQLLEIQEKERWFWSASCQTLPILGIPSLEWKQDSYRFTFRTLVKSLRVLQEVIHKKNKSEWGPLNTPRANFWPGAFTTLSNTSLQWPPTNLWVQKTEIGVFY